MSPLELRLRLRELRERAGLTQQELAERAGTSQVTVWRLESGSSRRIEFDLLDRLARALGVRADELGALFERTRSKD